MVVILGERPVAARLPGQLGGEGGEDVVEAVAHDHVVVDGNCIIALESLVPLLHGISIVFHFLAFLIPTNNAEGAHGEADAAPDRHHLPHGHRAQLRELAQRHLHVVHRLACRE